MGAEMPVVAYWLHSGKTNMTSPWLLFVGRCLTTRHACEPENSFAIFPGVTRVEPIERPLEGLLVQLLAYPKVKHLVPPRFHVFYGKSFLCTIMHFHRRPIQGVLKHLRQNRAFPSSISDMFGCNWQGLYL